VRKLPDPVGRPGGYHALRGLLREDAPISASTGGEMACRVGGMAPAAVGRPAGGLPVGGRIYVKAGLEKERAAPLVAIAGLVDGRKVVVAVTPGHRESVESWSEVRRDLRDRGMNPPKLVIGDGHLGIWGALRNVWPDADQQRCWKWPPRSPLDFVGCP